MTYPGVEREFVLHGVDLDRRRKTDRHISPTFFFLGLLATAASLCKTSREILCAEKHACQETYCVSLVPCWVLAWWITHASSLLSLPSFFLTLTTLCLHFPSQVSVLWSLPQALLSRGPEPRHGIDLNSSKDSFSSGTLDLYYIPFFTYLGIKKIAYLLYCIQSAI